MSYHAQTPFSLPREMIESVKIPAYSASMIPFSISRSTTADEGSSLQLISHLSWIPGSQGPENRPRYLFLELPLFSVYRPAQELISRHVLPLSQISLHRCISTLSKKALRLARARTSRSIFRAFATSSNVSINLCHLINCH